MIDFLRSCMDRQVPLYHIKYNRVEVSSIQSITIGRGMSYITLDDGVSINVANIGVNAFWTRQEAEGGIE